MSRFIFYRIFIRTISYFKVISRIVLVSLSRQYHRLLGYIVSIKTFFCGAKTRPALTRRKSRRGKSSRRQSREEEYKCSSEGKMSTRKRTKNSLKFVSGKKKKTDESTSGQTTLDGFFVALNPSPEHQKDGIKHRIISTSSMDLVSAKKANKVKTEGTKTSTIKDQEGMQLNKKGMGSKKKEDIGQATKSTTNKQSSNKEQRETKGTDCPKKDSKTKNSPEADRLPDASDKADKSAKDTVSPEGKEELEGAVGSLHLKDDSKGESIHVPKTDKPSATLSKAGESSKDKAPAGKKLELEGSKGSLHLKEDSKSQKSLRADKVSATSSKAGESFKDKTSEGNKKVVGSEKPLHQNSKINPKPSAQGQPSSPSKVLEGASSKTNKPLQDKKQQGDIKDHNISDSETGSESSSDTQPISPRKAKHSMLPSKNRSPRRQQSNPLDLLPSSWSSRDTEAYRHGYPGKSDNLSLNDNLYFYSNKMECKPRGTLIDAMHAHWFGDYSLLEEHHGYIQWLFPIREQGMNWQSQELQPHEAKRISADAKMRDRVLKSYEMMLDFWGMRLEDRQTGEICRDEKWKERFRHLNRSSHNYLRITRVLKSLGELGFENLKLPFLKFILEEIIREKTLANAQTSCLNYWINTLKSSKELEEVRSYAREMLNRTCKY